MRIRTTVLIFLICSTVQAFAQNTLPPNAEHIRKFVNDEKALVAAAREYQLQQTDLMQWDYDISEKNSESDDESLQNAPHEMLKSRMESVRMVWEYVLSIFPNNARAMNYFGEYWYEIGGNAAAAITYWKRAVINDPGMSLAYNNLGIHYFHTGDYRNGLTNIEKAVEIEPENPDLLFNITQMYLNYYPMIVKSKKTTKKKLYSQAMKYSRSAARLAPDDFSLAQDYAVNFFAAENFGVDADWDKAAEAWQHAGKMASTEQEKFYTELNQARCWIFGESYENAITALKSALVIRPENDIVERLLREVQAEIDKK